MTSAVSVKARLKNQAAAGRETMQEAFLLMPDTRLIS